MTAQKNGLVNDPTMLGQITFTKDGDIQAVVRYKNGKFNESHYEEIASWTVSYCLSDPEFFTKLRKLFIDNLCYREYNTSADTMKPEQWRLEAQEAVRLKLIKEKSDGQRETTTP
jgi:hypothetical protein